MSLDWSKFERKKNRLRIRWQWAKYDDDIDQVKKFYRAIRRNKSSSSYAKPKNIFIGNRNLISLKQQNVMVKFNYSRIEKSHKTLLEQYLPQERKENVKEKPVFFSAKSL